MCTFFLLSGDIKSLIKKIDTIFTWMPKKVHIPLYVYKWAEPYGFLISRGMGRTIKLSAQL
jgi:hypothetical protein